MKLLQKQRECCKVFFAKAFILDVWQGSEHASGLKGIQSPIHYIIIIIFLFHYGCKLLFEQFSWDLNSTILQKSVTLLNSSRI